jgi:hypothetical protein
MNKNQSAQLDSLKLIVKESTDHPNSIAPIPKFGIIINRLGTICNKIDIFQIDQEKNLTGITDDTDVVHENMVDSTVEIAGAVYSHAHEMKNNTLMAKVNYKLTAVERMTQTELIVAGGVVLEEAEKIPTAILANEGITPEELTAYKQLIPNYKAVKSSNKEAVIDRSGTTETLSSLFKEASALLKGQLDRLALQLKRKDPDFYRRYKTARKVQTRAAAKKVVEAGNPPA